MMGCGDGSRYFQSGFFFTSLLYLFLRWKGEMCLFIVICSLSFCVCCVSFVCFCFVLYRESSSSSSNFSIFNGQSGTNEVWSGRMEMRWETTGNRFSVDVQCGSL
jgi:hypothetical protein